MRVVAAPGTKVHIQRLASHARDRLQEPKAAARLPVVTYAKAQAELKERLTCSDASPTPTRASGQAAPPRSSAGPARPAAWGPRTQTAQQQAEHAQQGLAGGGGARHQLMPQREHAPW